MHKYLSCTISRLPVPEAAAILRVSGCLPGLHPIHLYWFRTRMTDVPFPRQHQPDLSIPSKTTDRVSFLGAFWVAQSATERRGVGGRGAEFDRRVFLKLASNWPTILTAGSATHEL